MQVKRWIVSEPDGALAAELAQACEMHPFLALLLTTRGITTPEEAADFLIDGELEDDPFAFADMDLAVERLQRAIDEYERIAVYGDYDADGVTATALLYQYLAGRGADVVYYIPEREGEGYGLHREAIDRLAEQGVRLLVTVDNGIAACEEAAYAASRGMEVIITDHHQPQETLPAAVAVVDPHRDDCGSQFKEYAGVGVAFKLLCALDGDVDALLEDYGDLVALGTLADVMPLRGENRRLVRAGLRVLNARRRPGLARLAEVAGIKDKKITATSAVFTLSPRLNAAGRMGSPEKAAQLLLAQDDAQALSLAEEIQRLNVQRQTTEAAILEQILAALRQQPALLDDRVLVVQGEGWHPGVLGILASRLLERFGRPCIVLTVQDGAARGSGRSLPGFPLFEALRACREELTAYGGHALAAGLTLEAGRVEGFREKINAYAAQVCPVMPVAELHIDFRMRPSQIDGEKLDLLAALEPCGTGNAAPVFGLYQMRLQSIVPIGQDKHLRLTFERDGTQIRALKFHTTKEECPVQIGAVYHLAVTLDKSEFHGQTQVTAIIQDMRYADTDQEKLIAALDGYARLCRGEWLPPEEQIPDRELCGRLYRVLRRAGDWTGTLEQLAHAAADGEPMEFLPLRLALEVFRQAGLIALEDQGGRLSLKVLPVQGKAELEATPLMRRLRNIG